MYLTRGRVRVEITDIGEGIQGEYNPEDPQDVSLVRFYVSIYDETHKEWTDVDDASYCTLIPVREEVLHIALAEKIMEAVYPPLMAGKDIDRICAALSWTEPEELSQGGV